MALQYTAGAQRSGMVVGSFNQTSRVLLNRALASRVEMGRRVRQQQPNCARENAPLTDAFTRSCGDDVS